jgi:hypothetical protein
MRVRLVLFDLPEPSQSLSEFSDGKDAKNVAVFDLFFERDLRARK